MDKRHLLFTWNLLFSLSERHERNRRLRDEDTQSLCEYNLEEGLLPSLSLV